MIQNLALSAKTNLGSSPADRFPITEGYNNRPSLTLFIWEDGALFDDAINDYIGSDSPSGLDPFRPLMLLSTSSSTGNTSLLMSVSRQNLSVI